MKGVEKVLATSEAKHREGDFCAAALVLLRPIENLLNTRSKASVVLFHRDFAWPLSNVRVCLSQLEVKLELLTNDFCNEEVAALQAYYSLLLLNKASSAEKCTVAIERLFVRSYSCLSFSRFQLYLANATGHLVWWLQLLDAPAVTELRRRVLAISFLLKEPEKKAIQLLRRHHVNRYRGAVYRHRLHSEGDSEGDYRWPELEAYRRYIAGSQQSRILLGVHLGDYIGAYLRIGRESQEGWKVLVPRRERKADDSVSSAPLGRNIEFLNSDNCSPLSMAARLRQGRHTLAIMADLHAGFGETVQVNFFGQPARFVKGPACIALLSACPVIPFVSFRDEKQNQLFMSEAIYPSVYRGETFSDAVLRLTQKFAAFCECWISRYPEQWKFLGESNLFLDESLMRSQFLKRGAR